ncbi:glutamate--cysteine ligase [Geodermatophilus marinus]|uniref:glutamate--cysteine ligase n=1 Tax=Geodermatophilus sp. LHW52908 TaxID=2303986 RepID=UPI001F3E3352|nr:glutamate--cysteine ligase [Geodermatophilus sp. LHW52908]
MRTVGVEEELLVVDAAGRPTPRGPAALRVAASRGEGETVGEHDHGGPGEGGDAAGARLVPELKAQQVEFGTRVCERLDDVAAEVRHWRQRADAAARAVGARVAALASSPVAVEPVTTPGERYALMTETFGLTALEQLTCGCHVHVSVDGDEEGVAVLDRIRVWLPVLTALSANSPFWLGRDSGHASYRAQAWGRWPSAGPTEPFGSAEGYHGVVEQLLASGTIVDAGMVYFDARLSERWPTVEVRTADVLLHAEHAVVLAGLVRGLVETAAREWRAGHPAPRVRSELLRVAGWRASRSGLDGELVHPASGRPAPAAAVVAALLDHVGEALVACGDDARVRAGVADLVRGGTGAAFQRRVHRETGELAAVVRAAVTATRV